MPLISVIIPVYNGEKTIAATIRSALNQTFTDLELIVINDGSQDRTLEIINGINDPRLRVFSYSNARQAVSRNRGLAHAVGQYVAFLDADDLWVPDKLKKQLEALQNHPEAAVAYCWTDCINEKGKFLRSGCRSEATGNVYRDILLMDFIGSGSNPLIKREALADIGEFDPELPPAEDWDLWIRLASRYKFVLLPFPQVLYRICENSASSNVMGLEVACIKVITKAFNQAPETLQPLKRYSFANIYKYLTFKVLESPSSRQQGLLAIRFLQEVIKNDPTFLQARVIFRILLRASAIALLPPKQAQAIIRKFKLFQINALLGYIQTEGSKT